MSAQATALAALHMTLFGPFQVQVQGQPLPHLRSRKSLYLLALLALRHGRPVEREWLAGILWPDADQSQAFANLRPVLSALREALGEAERFLQAPGRRTLLLDLSKGAYADISAFDTAVASGTLRAQEQAVRLYRGPLLEGWTEEWLVQDREARAQDCLKALQTLATASTKGEDFTSAAEYWRRAVTMDPLWEVARRGRMEMLARSGDSNAALQVYRELAAMLQSSDVRAVPDAETTALYRRLREQTRQKATVSAASPIDVSPQVSGYVPHAPTELIGREDERSEVAERLRRSRLVTLIGPGGIGKTRLAVAVAREVVREFPEGVWLVGLESLPPSSGTNEERERSITQQIASALGLKEGNGRSLLPLLTEHLRRKRLLLVLDNCEHIAESCARVVAHLLRECFHARILATSREPLRVSGEAVWSVPALSFPEPERLPTGKATLARAIGGYEAVQLFVERAKASQRTFDLTAENAGDIALLCSRLDGVPLALELAAARTVALTPAQIRAQLDARPLDALMARQRDIPPRHRTLRATLEWSYHLLPPEAQAFLASMGIFRGGWTLEAAQAVCPGADAIEMLILLRDASLIRVSEFSDGSRFTMLETVRQFAAEALERSGRTTEVQRRHTQYFSRWLPHEYEEPNRHRFFSTVEREYANIATALKGAMEIADDEILYSFCYNLFGFWEHTGRVGEILHWMGTISDRLTRQTGNREISAGVPQDLGSRSVPLTTRQTLLLNTRISLLSALGDSDAAARLCLRIFQDYDDSGNQIEGRTHLFNAGVYLLSSDLKRSLEILEKCLPLEIAASNDGQANPIILSQLALVNRLVGNSERATTFLHRALDVCSGREESDAHGYGRALWIASLAARAEGDPAAAREFLHTVVAIAKKGSISILQTFALCGLAAIARETGDQDQDQELLAAATAVAGPTPAFRLVPTINRERSEQLLVRGDGRGAMMQIRETLMLFSGKGRSVRLYAHAFLLLLSEALLAETEQTKGAEQAATLLGAAEAVATRLGLVVPDPVERDRAQRLRTALTHRLGTEHFTFAGDAGAGMDDEAALEFALRST